MMARDIPKSMKRELREAFEKLAHQIRLQGGLHASPAEAKCASVYAHLDWRHPLRLSTTLEEARMAIDMARNVCTAWGKLGRECDRISAHADRAEELLGQCEAAVMLLQQDVTIKIGT